MNKRVFFSPRSQDQEKARKYSSVLHRVRQSLPNTEAGKELFLWIEFSSGVQMGVWRDRSLVVKYPLIFLSTGQIHSPYSDVCTALFSEDDPQSLSLGPPNQNWVTTNRTPTKPIFGHSQAIPQDSESILVSTTDSSAPSAHTWLLVSLRGLCKQTRCKPAHAGWTAAETKASTQFKVKKLNHTASSSVITEIINNSLCSQSSCHPSSWRALLVSKTSEVSLRYYPLFKGRRQLRNSHLCDLIKVNVQHVSTWALRWCRTAHHVQLSTGTGQIQLDPWDYSMDVAIVFSSLWGWHLYFLPWECFPAPLYRPWTKTLFPVLLGTAFDAG